MALDDLSLAELDRLIAALVQAGGEEMVAKLIERMPLTNQPHGRVTVRTIRQLLDQLNGRTVLPDRLVELLAGEAAVLGTIAAPGENSVSWNEARAIMGEYAISVKQTEEVFGVLYTPYQRGQLAVIPWSAKTLRHYAATHILFPGYPLTIAEMVKHQSQPIHLICRNDPYITTEQVELRWYLLRRGPVPGSANRTFPQQVAQLSADQEVPRACELTYGVILGKWILGVAKFSEKAFLLCREMNPRSFRVMVRIMDGELEYNGTRDDQACDDHALASMLKVNTS